MIQRRNIRQEIKELEQDLSALAKEAPVTMRGDLKRMLLSGGKRLRPALALLCYQMGEKRSLPIRPLMLMLELMHTASLIHDDVVDHSPKRRGVATINETSGISAAVQSGDYLLAKAMEYLPIYRGTGINEALAEISTQMCLGEFQQMKSLFSLEEQTLERYYLQIRRKTACLIGDSCYTGALAGGLSKKEAAALKRYGECIGTAFQLQDDILDYVGREELGKPLGQDLSRGVFTLPLLYALKTQPMGEYHRLAVKRKKGPKEVRALVVFVQQAKGISYARDQVMEYTRRAKEQLLDLPGHTHRELLGQLADGLTGRKK